MPFKSDKQRRFLLKNKPDLAREWVNKYEHQDGGMLYGPSHEEGGIPGIIGGEEPAEFEGGEYVIKKNSVTPETIAALQYINETGQLPLQNDVTFAKEGGLIRDASKRRRG